MPIFRRRSAIEARFRAAAKKQVASTPKGRFRRNVKRAVLGTAGVAAMTASLYYGGKNLANSAAQNRAAMENFFNSSKNAPAWIDASKKLGISGKKLKATRPLSAAAMSATEKKAASLGKDGLRRLVETVARYGDEWESNYWAFDSKERATKNPAEKARLQRIKDVLHWYSTLPEQQRLELLEFSGNFDIPGRE